MAGGNSRGGVPLLSEMLMGETALASPFISNCETLT